MARVFIAEHLVLGHHLFPQQLYLTVVDGQGVVYDLSDTSTIRESLKVTVMR